MSRTSSIALQFVLITTVGWWLLGSSLSLANNDIWKTAANGVWGTGSNWVDGTTPGNSDGAWFDKTGSYTVTLNANPLAIHDLTVINSGDNVTFTSSGAARTININSAGGGQDALISDGATVTLGKTDDPAINLTVGDDLHIQLGGALNAYNSTINASRLTLLGGGQASFNLPTTSLRTTSPSTIGGVFAATNTLTINNGAIADLNTLNVGTSGVGGEIDTFNVLSAANVTFNLQGGDLNVGAVSGSTGTVNIQGTFTPRKLTVNPTGTINILSFSNVGFAGTTVIDGGKFNADSTATLLTNGTFPLTLQNGALATIKGDFRINGLGGYKVHGMGTGFVTQANNGGTGGSLSIGDNALLTVEAGGAASSPTVTVGPGLANNNGGLLTIDGAGSIMQVGSTLTVGEALGGGPGNVWITNDGTLSVQGFAVSPTTVLQPTGTIYIMGATANLGTLVERGGAVNFASGTLRYTGNLTVGGGGLLGTDLTLNADRVLNVHGVTTVDAGHSLVLSGGTLDTDRLVVNGGCSFSSGNLLNSTGTVLNLDGVGYITFFNSVNSPIVSNSASLSLDTGGPNITLGDASRIAGFSHQGTFIVRTNTVTLNSASFAKLGIMTTLGGGTISAPNGISFGSGSNFVGHGSVSARIAADLGSVIEADGDLALGDGASPVGFVSNGELRTKEFAVTLNCTAQTTLGTLTTLGSGAGPGTLNASNGFSIDFGKAVTGYGAINSTNTLANHAVINGLVQGNSPAQPITLSGYIKGTGTFSNVNFTGTYSPGVSPTVATVGNVSLSPSSTLIMEIGGATPGSGYDQIQSSGTITLGGTLHVLLLAPFTPTVGQPFDLFEGPLSGTFAALQLPILTGPLGWDTSQLYSAGLLTVTDTLRGDFTRDGHVDAADIAAMIAALANLTNYKSSNGLTDQKLLTVGDVNQDNKITGGDVQALLDLLKSGGGNSFDSVPEPSTFILGAMFLSLLLLGAAGHRRPV